MEKNEERNKKLPVKRFEDDFLTSSEGEIPEISKKTLEMEKKMCCIQENVG